MQTDASIRLYGYLDMIKLNKGKRDESVKIFLIENKYVNWKKKGVVIPCHKRLCLKQPISNIFINESEGYTVNIDQVLLLYQVNIENSNINRLKVIM